MALLKKMSKSPKTAKQPSGKAPQAKKSSQRIFSDEMRLLVEQKAYEFYEARGRQPGQDLSDWFKAESIIKPGRK